MRPSKCRSTPISKGKLVEESFYIDGEMIPFIVEKLVKSSGMWCNSMLSDPGQVEELRECIAQAIKTIDKTYLN